VGDVVVSIDAELSWGYHDLDAPPDRLSDAQEGWDGAIGLLDEYEVPATWAIVGHLISDGDDCGHRNHPLGSSWFPCSADGGRAGDWCAPELVAAVLAAEQEHEIASHTFSHVVMNGDEVTREVAAAEMDASLAAAERFGLELESVVFPRNRVAHRAVLAERGFRCYRGVRPRRYRRNAAMRPLAKLAGWAGSGNVPPIFTPTVDEYGLVDVPASLYLFSFEGAARRVAGLFGYRPIVSIAKRGIDAAVDADGVFHLWFHPHNLLQPDGVERLNAILDYLNRRREETDLRVRTMAQVARDVREEQIV
jgi:peptidoglycan/xylan/chitin deacetylase (PgdA/CDA1 family)